MHKITDTIINLLRWPAAIYLLLSLPALLNVYHYFSFYSFHFYMLGVGVTFFIFTIFASGYSTRQAMQIISHELTHTFFAYLTLHTAGRLRLNPDGSGGSMSLNGHGNWLITLSPYFFPLFAFFYMLIMPLLAEATDSHWILYAILGYFLAYHWLVVLTQTHLQQTDIIREGYVFSGFIIIGGNLFTTGFILAFASKSWDGIVIFWNLVNKLNLQYAEKIYDLVVQNF